MSFARRQTIERACNLLLREPQRISNRHPFKHLRQRRAASQRRRATISEKARGFNPIIDLAAAKTPWIFDSVVVSDNYLKANRATLTRFVKAYVAGAYLALADDAKAKEVIAQKFKTSDPKVIAATYDDFKRLMPRDAAPSREGAENVLAQLEAIGTDIGSRNPADYLDLSIIEALKQEGYFAQLDKIYPMKP